jgi:hypothetical protein
MIGPALVILGIIAFIAFINSPWPWIILFFVTLGLLMAGLFSTSGNGGGRGRY